jgi:hypothetical protein
VYLNPLKKGEYKFGKLKFEYEPFYIGLSRTKLRMDKHIIIAKMNEKYNKKTFKDNIILKIIKSGKEPIRYKLYENISPESAKRLEICLIKKIGRRDLGLGTLVNHTGGGDGLIELTDKLRKCIGRKVSEAWKNGSYNNVDYNWTKGENNHFYGKNHTEHTKNKIREYIGDSQKGELNANYGNNWTDIQKNEASIRQKENHKHLTGDNNPSKRQDVRRKISKSKIGLKNPNGELWELVSTIGEKYIIEGGIKRNLKNYGLNYQQFRNCEVIDGYMINKVKKGWKLKKK